MNLKSAAKLSDLTRLMSEEAAEVPEQKPTVVLFKPGVFTHDEIISGFRPTSMQEISEQIRRHLEEQLGAGSSSGWFMNSLVDAISERTALLWGQAQHMLDEQTLNVTSTLDGEWVLAR